MTALIFALAIVFIFIAVLVFEQSLAPSSSTATTRPSWGLLGWLTSGNWPAKLGAGLLVIGGGALLRYALINIELPPQIKLAGGFVIAATLGLAAFFTGREGRRPSIALALGGAAFGVAYLTSYSAYALFGYVTELAALALLGGTSIAAATYAGQRNAISVAILSMLGAFLAPAFALGAPGPTVVLGYYLVASLLVLALVMWRGWRPLIHLSFLFTLAGGVFFGWSAEYYQPANYSQVWPLTFALFAAHLAMPIAEQQRESQRWLQRLDIGYVIVVPLVAIAIAFSIAPNRPSFAWLLAGFAGLWLIVAIARRALGRDGVATHFAIAAAFGALALATGFEQLPWELIGLGMCTLGLIAADRVRPLAAFRSGLAGGALLFGALHVIDSIFGAAAGAAPFANADVAERVAGGSMLLAAAYACHRAKHTMAATLGWTGAAWLLVSIAIELARIDWIEPALLLHAVAAMLAIGIFVTGTRWAIPDWAAGLTVGAIALTAFAIKPNLPLPVILGGLILAPLACLAIALRHEDADREPRFVRGAALLASALTAAAWTALLAWTIDVDRARSAALALIASGRVGLALARRHNAAARAGATAAEIFFFMALCLILLISTLFDIERSALAVALELAALAALVYLIPRQATGAGWKDQDLVLPAAVVAGALIVQATILRWLGPPGHLTIADVFEIRMPALVTLMWAAFGAALTIAAVRTKSRTVWICGSVLLIASAVKVVLVDFGSLGQLANILAVIAAGGVFLLVGWLAPIPPGGGGMRANGGTPTSPTADGPSLQAVASAGPTAAGAAPASSPSLDRALEGLPRDTDRTRAWLITAAIIIGAAPLARCSGLA
jgi:Predicted membrane protein (DUF2339)